MKKTILTFSILISSPIFNTFAVGGDTIIEIAPSSIEELQAIANNPQKDEKERLDACKKLMTSQDINKDALVSILFKMAKEFTIYHTTALDVLWNDLETKEKYLDVLAPLYFDHAKNTKYEIFKTVIFDKLFYDQQCKIKYADELVALALDQAENGKNPNYIQGSLDKLWKDADIKEKYRPVLSKALLICAQQDKNEIGKSNTINALWNDPATRQTYHDELVNFLLDFAQNGNVSAFFKLWNNPEAKLAHFNTLDALRLNFLKNGLIEEKHGTVQVVLTLFSAISQPNVNTHLSNDDLFSITKDPLKSEQERLDACKKLMTSQDVNKDEIVSILFKMAKEFTIYHTTALDVLWNDPETKEKYLDVLAQLYFNHAKNTKDENSKSVIFNKLFGDQQCKIKYVDELIALALDQAENGKNQHYIQGSLNKLWEDSDIKEKYRPILSKALLICAQQDTNKRSRSNTIHALWSDLETRQTYHDELINLRTELIEADLEFIKNTQDEIQKDQYLSKLWNDPATKEAYRGQLVTVYLELFKNTQDEAIENRYFSMLWYDPVIKEAHRAELVASCLERVDNTQDEAKKAQYLWILWDDPVTKEAHRAELIAAYLELFRNTQDETQKAQYLSILWNDPATKEAHRAELVATYLDLLRNTQDETKKDLYLSMLWSDQNTRENHLHELIACHIDLVEHAAQKWIRDNSFNDLNNDIAARQIFNEQHNNIFEAAQERMKSEASQEQKLENYLRDGDTYQEAFQSFIAEYWAHLSNADKAILCQKYVNQFSEDNPRVQELLLLLARDGGPRGGAVNVYADLLLKIKEPFAHHPSVTALTYKGNNQTFRFAV
ncbi:MAG: hypothetical protein Q8K37_00115, partial [Alphaproteobacteria bacterium]|nr:hypothetical protein [Alphaproteobacteria bacterium]